MMQRVEYDKDIGIGQTANPLNRKFTESMVNRDRIFQRQRYPNGFGASAGNADRHC